MNSKSSSYESIKLEPLQMEDFSIVEKWSKDKAFCLANGWEINRNHQELYEWWTHCVHLEKDDFKRMGIIHEGQLIGYVDLANIHNTTAEIGIAIGESSLWGKGIGKCAIKRLMEYASKKLGITIFEAETHESNQGARRLFEKMGFQEVSRNGTEQYKGVETSLIQLRLSSMNAEEID